MQNIEIREKKQLLNAILRNDFSSFVRKVFGEVSGNSNYMHNWHIDVICNYLQDVLSDKESRLIINIPPRNLKSIICSIAFPAFILGHNPKATIICVSYADDLAGKLALDCRKVMESTWYKECFPITRLSSSRKILTDFETTQGGGRFSTSVNGILTGRGADYIVIDDPLKPVDANSDLLREKTNDWYGNTLYSRLNDKNKGKIILVMQRLHQNDLTGYLLETDKNFKLLKMPALAEEYETWEIRNSNGELLKTVSREVGDPLHPEREDLAQLELARQHMGEYNFNSQYQQNPISRGGNVIKKEWLHFESINSFTERLSSGKLKIKQVVQSWDTANKAGLNNDYSVGIDLLYCDDNRFYVLNVTRVRMEFPNLIREIVNTYENAAKYYSCKNVFVLIEDKGSGTQLLQMLRSSYGVDSYPAKPEGDKIVRMRSISFLVERGACIFVKDHGGWWADFERELLAFPNSKYDDQCDALSQALLYAWEAGALINSLSDCNIIKEHAN